MNSTRRSRHRLVADLGGTNTRLALFDTGSGSFSHLNTYRNLDHSGFDKILDSWLRDYAEPVPDICSIAVAAPPSDDTVKMSNIDWTFSCDALARQFGFSRVTWLNDFQANAYSLPHLGQTERSVLHPGGLPTCKKLAVMGPGTGLGGATLDNPDGRQYATSCEPGHMGLSPSTEEELALFAKLIPTYGEIFAERLVSGPGLLLLYQTLADIRGEPALASVPEEVSRMALQDDDPLGQRTLGTFCGLLGSACGDFVLASGAYGGLYLAGGIIPGMLEFLQASTFHQRFRSKGVMQEHLAAVPIYAITTQHPGLLGAAHAPL